MVSPHWHWVMTRELWWGVIRGISDNWDFTVNSGHMKTPEPSNKSFTCLIKVTVFSAGRTKWRCPVKTRRTFLTYPQLPSLVYNDFIYLPLTFLIYLILPKYKESPNLQIVLTQAKTNSSKWFTYFKSAHCAFAGLKQICKHVIFVIWQFENYGSIWKTINLASCARTLE